MSLRVKFECLMISLRQWSFGTFRVTHLKEGTMVNNAATASQDALVRRLGVLNLTLSGAITASVIFLLCWVGTFVPFSSPTHAYISLFTNASMNSVQALGEGLCWSFLFGGVFAAAFALIYNSVSGLTRRN